ncbi:phosphatidylserine decarboxylase [Kangiella profundi]|uniref:Phosphatidylserine decarboxylase proenzyme n=1 Tax=Kangiella profundi TaxID=1561924 RepID=A0A2K9AZN0_9GAMM|nr:archaetidylserine decarboxylase [Kangiella profundi]AUD78128.1 phosphatidylserine decarboxylase [Kangiella profundi]GGF05291.1 phosphatidylserine decarboxylase proenzyme [Kangiella profundi]
MSDTLKVLSQYLIPQHGISLLMGKIAESENVKIKNAFIKWFIKKYGIDMSIAERENPEDYKTFNDFFTRSLKADVRPIDSDDNSIVHPADGAISQLGKIDNGYIFQAKGHTYSAKTLLGGDADLAAPFQDGEFATVYLAPKDYHRLHMPIDGQLTKMIHVPGKLFSVNPLTARKVPNLFARNERVVAMFDTELGPMAMVLVGATIVGSVETVWHGTVTPPTRKEVRSWDYEHGEVSLKKGEEMGRFKLGSTIVLLFPKDTLEWHKNMKAYAPTVMGQPIAFKK